MLRSLKKRRLEIVSFGTGFALMTFELAAARILAPAIGSSVYVWTSVIGVIIAALSLGFFVGGRLADRRGHVRDIAILLLAATTASVATILNYQDILSWVAGTFSDGRVQGVVAASTLFAPCSFFIGVTSPYLAKLRVHSLSSTGRSIASLDACNAVGGIVGTFVTGFFLFGFVGSRETLICVSVLLLLLSWFFAIRTYLVARLVTSVILLLVIFLPVLRTTHSQSIDTASSHYEVIHATTDNATRLTGLVTGPSGVQSAVYADGSPDLVFWYTQEMTRLTIERQPKSILILGGGAFTMPQYLADNLPNSKIDVVEIDPKLEGISKEYFNYKSPSNVRVYAQDARTFVNQSNIKYDVILVDVYGDTMIPFSLITTEYGQAVAKLLSPEGVIIANLVVGPSGACREIFDSINAAYGETLPEISYRSEMESENSRKPRSNYVALYSRIPQDEPGYKKAVIEPAAAFNDNFAPIERLYFNCLQQEK